MHKIKITTPGLSLLHPTDLLAYRGLLTRPGLGLTELASQEKIERTACYRAIARLEQLGLVYAGKKGRRKIWFARSRGYFRDLIRETTTMLEQQYASLGQAEATNQPLVFEYLKGEQIKKFLKKIFAEKHYDNLTGITLPESFTFFMDRKEFHSLIKKRIRSKKIARLIMPRASSIPGIRAGEDWGRLRVIKTVDDDRFPITAIMESYRDFLFLIPKTTGVAEAIVIQNKHLARTFRSLFELAYRNLKNSPR